MTAIPETFRPSSRSGPATIVSSAACGRHSRRPTCPTARSRSGSTGRASISRTPWPRSPTARSPGSARSSPGSTWPARWSPRRNRPSRSATPCSPTATTWGSPGTAASASSTACRPRTSSPAGRVVGARARWRSGPPGSPPPCPWRRWRPGGCTGDGPVLVTGASGGVGGTAVAILAARGHEVWAATGKPDEEEPAHARSAQPASCPARRSPPRVPGRSSPADGRARSTRSGRRRCRTCCGRFARAPRSPRPATPAARSSRRPCFPFILRGVALLGMDSVAMPIEERRALWAVWRPTSGRTASARG